MTTEPRSVRRTPTGPGLLWMLLAGATAAGGLVAAAQLLPWQAATAVVLASGLLGASLTLSADAVSSDEIDLWHAGRRGLLTGLTVLVVVGLAGAAGALGVGLAALVLLTWPGLPARVRATLRRWRGQWAAAERAAEASRDDTRVPDREPEADAAGELPGRSPAPRPEPWIDLVLADQEPDSAPDWSPTLAVPTHLSDQDLCLAWESSSRALRRCGSAQERLEVVRVRQACLDELERRRPEAVRAWVLSGADPDSSPAPYLTR